MNDPVLKSASDIQPGDDRFVLQRVGDRVPIDWLLGLRHGNRLVTWSIPGGGAPRRLAPQLASGYRERPWDDAFYEGPDPEDRTGVARLTVRDRGCQHVVSWDDDEVVVDLFGAHLQGRYRLERVAPEQWQFHRSGTAGEDPTRRPLAPVPFMQPAPVDLGDMVHWALEPDWPGLRAMYRYQDAVGTLYDLDGRDRLGELGELRGLGDAAGDDDVLIDGVVVALATDRHPDRAALQARLSGTGHAPVVFVAVDVLYAAGQALDALSLDERRARLEDLVLSGRHWVTTPQWTDVSVDAALEAVACQGMSGIVAKRRGSPYDAGQPDIPWRTVGV